MSDKDFAALLERLRPEFAELIAQYEHKRSALLPILHLFQEHEGWVSPEAMQAASEMLALTQAEVEGTASFYTLFFKRPVGKYVLQVCRGLSCSINDADSIMAYFREKLGVANKETTEDGLFSYEEVECLASCDRATCMQVNLEFVYDLTPQKIDEMLAAMRAGTYAVAPMAQTDKPDRTWELRQDEQVSRGTKSAGAQDVSSPNNAGGVGDAAGIIMLDRIINKTVSFHEGTRERAVTGSRAIAEVVDSGENGRAGH